MIEPGRVESAQETVTQDVTAEAMGSGDVPVLATPAILASVERLAVASLADALQPGTTTVGARVELDHLAPTPVGASCPSRCGWWRSTSAASPSSSRPRIRAERSLGGRTSAWLWSERPSSRPPGLGSTDGYPR